MLATDQQEEGMSRSKMEKKKSCKIYGIIIQRRLYGSYVEIFSIN